MSIKKLPFNRSEIDFKNARSYRTKKKNQELFIKWCVDVLKENLGRELEENENYYAPAILMNKENCEWLHKYLDPLVYLSYAPTEDDTLMDDEIGIDMEKIVEKQDRGVEV